jgi:3-oxo-5alpha-steroid 4-dehydrogenase
LAEIDRFDEETDILVVGVGAAGAATALEGAAAGVEVIALERGGGGGGTSAMSGGVLYLGGGTSLQKACGFEDTSQAMFDYLMASSGPAPDEAKMRLYCEGSVEHFEWVVSQGVPFKETFYYGCSGEPPSDDGLVWSGSERCHPFCDLAAPAPRGHVPQHPHQTGPLLMQKLVAAVEASAARIITDHRVTDLVLAEDGRVVGAVAQSFGEERSFRARCGVVLTTGGFINDREMIQAHAPLVDRCKVRIGAEGDDGSGIRLGMAAGGMPIHMDAVSISLPVTQPWGLKRGLLINGQGQRFINEDAYYGRLGEWALLHQEGRAWLVVDDEIFEQPDYPRDVTAVGETLAELEAELELPAGSLEASVALYNRHAALGQDPLFHKQTEYLKPLDQPPFGAYDCTVDHSLYAAFTLGGLATDPDGRVLDARGEPVGGLYAAGRASSGLSVGSYSSGLSLGDGTFFGRRAGRAAARDAS